MKKFASLLLAMVMAASLAVPAFAETHSTTVTYTGTGVESYTVTVPATLAPGESGDVSVEGTWATNRKLTVTAPSTVTLTNDIDGGTKTLDVTFEGINQAGSDTVSQTVTKNISVGSIFNALFGTWTGVITYNVSMEDNGATPAPTLISFTIDGTSYQAEEGMTWGEWVDSEYNTDGFVYVADLGNIMLFDGIEPNSNMDGIKPSLSAEYVVIPDASSVGIGTASLHSVTRNDKIKMDVSSQTGFELYLTAYKTAEYET